MKTIEKLYVEIENSETLKNELSAVKDKDALAEFLKQHDCDATVEEWVKYIKTKATDSQGELSDDAVSSVSGGVWMDVGAGWIDVDVTLPARKTSPVLPEKKIIIIED